MQNYLDNRLEGNKKLTKDRITTAKNVTVMSQVASGKNSDRGSQTVSRTSKTRTIGTGSITNPNNRTAPGRLKNPVNRTDSALATSKIPTYIKEPVDADHNHYTLSTGTSMFDVPDNRESDITNKPSSRSPTPKNHFSSYFYKFQKPEIISPPPKTPGPKRQMPEFRKARTKPLRKETMVWALLTDEKPAKIKTRKSKLRKTDRARTVSRLRGTGAVLN